MWFHLEAELAAEDAALEALCAEALRLQRPDRRDRLTVVVIADVLGRPVPPRTVASMLSELNERRERGRG